MTNTTTRRHLTSTLVVLCLLAGHLLAQKVSTSELQYQEALHKQQVEGDLPGAIKLYEHLASPANKDGDVRLKALVRLASIYDTLGRKSETLYERIVRDYPNRPEAAAARKKLASLRPAASGEPTMKKIPLRANIGAVIATDGERVVYLDLAFKSLYISDVAGTHARKIYQSVGNDQIYNAIVSDDMSLVALSYVSIYRPADALEIVATDGSGKRDLPFKDIPPLETGARMWSVWSADNKFLVMCQPTLDGGMQIMKVSASDGKVDVIHATSKRPATCGILSPDDRFIAFGLTPTPREPAVSYVMDMKGGEPNVVASGAVPAAWTRDGRHLIVTEDREPSPLSALWGDLRDDAKAFAVPMLESKPAGAPQPLGVITPKLRRLRPARNGAMIAAVGNARPDSAFFISELSADDTLADWKELHLVDTYSEIATPQWSPTGRRIVYNTSLNAVRIRDLATGDDREVWRATGQVLGCVWARTQPRLYCGDGTSINPAIGVTGKTAIVSIDIDTRRVEVERTFDSVRYPLGISADDRTLFMMRLPANGPPGVRWEIGTTREETSPVPKVLTDDGQWLLSNRIVEGRRTWVVSPSAGGDFRPLFSRKDTGLGLLGPIPVTTTLDSKYVVYQDTDAEGKDGLYRVSISGGPPRRLGDHPSTNGMLGSDLSVSADGRAFIVDVARPPRREFWILENLIRQPAASTTSGARPASRSGTK